MVLFFLANFVNAQSNCDFAGVEGLVISEVSAEGRIEIYNGSDSDLDLAEYYLYTSPAYRQIEDLALDCGATLLAPGATLAVSPLAGFDAIDGEVALYTDSNFEDPGSIISYLEYGSAGHKRAPVAVAAGIWDVNDFVAPPTATASINAVLDDAGELDFASLAPSICTPNISITNHQVEVDGGAIALADGNLSTSICVDGNADPLEVVRDGNGTGPNRDFVITDNTGLILALPEGNGPFDLDGAGVGTCEIWYLAYADGLEGKVVGNNLFSDLEGCYDLSNPITVIREAADGGAVTLANGGTNFIGCAGDIVFDVTHTTTAPNLSYWYIITDDNNDILGFANSANTNTLDLSGAPAGTCRIWGWSYRGLPDPVVGEPLSSIAPDGSCADISDDFITVYREIPDGGTITTAGGASDTTVVAGDAFVTVAHTTTAQFLSYWYIITDDNGSILGFQNSTAGNTLDLSGAPVGTCRIWGWSYRGLDDPIIGEDIATLNDDFCETISTGFVTVIREGDDNGFEFNDVIINEVSNDGQVEIFNGTDEAIDVSNYWLCNFPTYTRLSNLTLECGSLMIQPGEYTVVSGFSAFNATDAELGLYRTNSFSSANAIVSYLEWGSSGHQRAGVAISAGIWTADFAVPAPTAAESIQTFTESGSLSWSLETPTLCENNNNTTSTNLLDNGVEINIYPNPTSDYINVELQGLTSPAVDMQVFNQAGQLVSDLHLDSGNGLNSLDLTNLPAGTYLLRVVSGNASTSHLISRF